MGNALATTRDEAAAKIERVLVGGDLSTLTAEERVQYYNSVCESIGLNPMTKPFAFLKLNGKEVLYALRDATDQIRKIHNVSISIVSRETVGDVYVVTARATLPSGRTDESIGAVTISNLKGDALANCLMKAETKSKRRVTLSIAGLGMLDEEELATIPGAQTNSDPGRRPARRTDTAVASLPENPLFAKLDDDELSLQEQQAAWAEAFKLVSNEDQRAQLRAHYKSKPRAEGLDFAVSASYQDAGKRIKGVK